jgi:hypothetical protein
MGRSNRTVLGAAAALAAGAAGTEAGAVPPAQVKPPEDKDATQTAQQGEQAAPRGPSGAQAQELGDIIASAVAQGVSAGMQAGMALAREALATKDPDEPPPPDPQEVMSEMQQQLAEDRYLIMIAKGDKHSVDPVPLGVNGILRTVKRGEYAVISRSMLEVLQNSEEEHIDPDTKEPYKVSSFPYTVHAKVPEDMRELPIEAPGEPAARPSSDADALSHVHRHPRDLPRALPDGVRECGIASGGGALPATVENQTNVLAKMVSRVAESWVEIQGEHKWSFLRKTKTITLAVGNRTYSIEGTAPR